MATFELKCGYRSAGFLVINREDGCILTVVNKGDKTFAPHCDHIKNWRSDDEERFVASCIPKMPRSTESWRLKKDSRPGKLGLPKGRMEDIDIIAGREHIWNLLDTAIRETEEETGYNLRVWAHTQRLTVIPGCGRELYFIVIVDKKNLRRNTRVDLREIGAVHWRSPVNIEEHRCNSGLRFIIRSKHWDMIKRLSTALKKLKGDIIREVREVYDCDRSFNRHYRHGQPAC